MITAVHIHELEKVAKLGLADIPLEELELFFNLISRLQEIQGIDHLTPLISPGYEETSFQTSHFLREDVVEEGSGVAHDYTVTKIL